MANRSKPAGRVAALLFAVLMAMAFAWQAAAVEPNEVLADPALETRARALSQQLRCLVCQNQSIDDSNAELAHDLRVLVRDRLVAGDSDEAVVAYIVSRYGQFVLLKPPFHAGTYALWLGPAAILAIGSAAVVFYLRRRGNSKDDALAPLTEAEQQRLQALLSEKQQ